MKAPRIMIAAPGSGSGKTLLTCVLLQVLKNRKKSVAAFKCGPDFIDPMFHQKVIGVPSKNLDTFLSDEDTARYLFLEDAKGKDISVIEGVMGLYDGLAGMKEDASSYHLARVTKTPVILVIDAHGMGRSIIPLIAGFLQYDRAHLIKGVILNNITGMFYEVIKTEIEGELPVTVLGYFPKQKEIQLESRHLGLKLPGEVNGLKEEIEKLAAVMTTTVDINKVLDIALGADELTCSDVLPGEELFTETELSAGKEPVFEKELFSEKKQLSAKPIIPSSDKKLRIGVARDEAFCFYYEDNLRLLKKYNAELVFFSPLRDEELPEDIHGCILGGGYPELYAKDLSENQKMRESIKAAISKGMPSIAECGGFMYLHETLVDMEGEAYPMVGAVKGSCLYTGKLVRFGYIELTGKSESYLGIEGKIKGHEFHYFDSTDNGASCVAEKPITERSWQCVHADTNHWWGFPHLYYYSNIEYVSNFLERAGEYEESTQSCLH